MVSLPPVANVIRCTLIGTQQTSSWANVFHVKYAGTPPTASTLQSFLTGWANAYTTNFASAHLSTVAYTEARAVDLTSTTSAFATIPLTGNGTVSSAGIMSNNVALVISWTIQQRYRGGHPRTYLCGQSNSNLFSVTTWASTWTAAVSTKATAFLNAVNALSSGAFGPYTMGAVNYWIYGQHPPAMRSSGVFYPISAASVHPRVDTQRRRLGKETF